MPMLKMSMQSLVSQRQMLLRQALLLLQTRAHQLRE
jgi:hypothetical protein